MTEKNFKIYIDDLYRIIVYLKTENGQITNFVVKLEFFYETKWMEVERFDCFHDCIHKDILGMNKIKKRTIWYKHLTSYKDGLNVAINDFRENYLFYIERFLNEK